MLTAHGTRSVRVSHDTIAWAREQLGVARDATIAAGPVVRGSQAEISFLPTRDGEPAVLKVLTDPDPERDLRVEYAALTTFHTALASNDRVRCPQPLSLHPSGRAYLMTKVPGGPLDRVELSEDRLDTITGLLLEGLSIYYGSVGDLYADLQPSNVLVTEGSIALIDPTLPAAVHSEIAATLRHGPAAADIGYWTYSVVSRAVLAAVVDRVAGARRMRATEALLRKAPGFFGADARTFWADVEFGVMARLARLRRAAPMKGVLLDRLGRDAFRRMLRRIGA